MIDVISPRLLTTPYKGGLLPVSVKAKELRVVLKNCFPVFRFGFIRDYPFGPALKRELVKLIRTHRLNRGDNIS